MKGDGSNRTALKLAVVAVAMFAFGYIMVPLYSVFCDITGINGKTGIIAAQEAESLTVDSNRLVTVEFDSNVNGELPWNFRPLNKKLKVSPGEISEAVFVVENNSEEPIIGQAIPSVAPAQASLFFNKTECFCFTTQLLAPGERKEMAVRFVIDPEMPEKISTLTLSYTFFMAPGENNVVQTAIEQSPLRDQK